MSLVLGAMHLLSLFFFLPVLFPPFGCHCRQQTPRNQLETTGKFRIFRKKLVLQVDQRDLSPKKMTIYRLLFANFVVFLLATCHGFAPSLPKVDHSQRVQLSMVDSVTDAILPSIIFLGAAVATIYTSENPNAVKELAQKSVENVEKAAEEVKEEIKEEVEVIKAPEPTPAPAPKPAPAPVASTKTTTASKPLSDLVKEVASTVEEQRETQERVAKRQAQAAAEAAEQSALDFYSDAAEEQEPEATTFDTSKAPKRKRKLAMRILKKVVAPWRKWENIK